MDVDGNDGNLSNVLQDANGERYLLLGNGTKINLADWTDGGLRSALVIDPWSTDCRWELFTYTRETKIPGTNITATHAHTNVPRSGDSGLPMNWEMHVAGWRAQGDFRLDQHVIRWAAETAVQFEYNAKFYGDTTLLDLLLHRQPLGRNQLPVHVREHLGYRVNVATPPAAMQTFREWLRSGDLEASNVRDAVLELDTIIRLRGESDPLTASLRHVQSRLVNGRTITLWVHLEGPINRPVV